MKGNTNRSTGTVKWFDVFTGTGCIVNESGVEVLFCYRDIQTEGLKALGQNERVTYVEACDDQGLFATYVYVI